MRSGWAFQVARVAGIPVRIHATFLLLVAWVALIHYQQDPHLHSVGLGVAFLLTVFGLVVLHELSHALVARLFGVGTRDITLWPIGGVSSLGRMPEEPLQELAIAVAGPCLNLAVAALLVGGLALTGDLSPLLGFDYALGWREFVGALVWANLALAAFNLLPAFPMDGGRALRSGLCLFMDRLQATRLAATVARGLALLFGLAGLFWSPILVLIAVFVWLGAGAEASHEELVVALRGHGVRRAMVDRPQTLAPEDPLDMAAGVLIRSGQRAYPVVSEGHLVGCLGESGLLRALASAGRWGRVGDHMRPVPPRVRAEQSLLDAYRVLREGGAPCVAVVDDEGDLLGIVTSRSLNDFLNLSAALSGDPRRLRRVPPRERRSTASGQVRP